ncbi:MAG: ATP-binding protein [Oscillospiraceae bacterium]|nr:ATP-binding protein [Oscillospiraceae bacterium]
MVVFLRNIRTHYNPLEKEDPDVSQTLVNRKIGGLGIFMVKKNMDHVSYEYRNGQHIFTMEKKLTEE